MHKNKRIKMKIRKFNENKTDNNLYDALQNIKDVLNIDDEDSISIKHISKRFSLQFHDEKSEYLISEMGDINGIDRWSELVVKLYDIKIIMSPKDSNEEVFKKSIKFFKNLIRINNTLPGNWKLSSNYNIDLDNDIIEIVLIEN